MGLTIGPHGSLFFPFLEHSSALFPLRCTQGPPEVSDRPLFFFRDVSTLFEFLQGVIPVLPGPGVLQSLTPLIYISHSAGRTLTVSQLTGTSSIAMGMCAGEDNKIRVFVYTTILESEGRD